MENGEGRRGGGGHGETGDLALALASSSSCPGFALERIHGAILRPWVEHPRRYGATATCSGSSRNSRRAAHGSSLSSSRARSWRWRSPSSSSSQGSRPSSYSTSSSPEGPSATVADILLLLAASRLFSSHRRRCRGGAQALNLALLLWAPALLIVNYIHFQYNGCLLGILLLSLAFLEEGNIFAAAFGPFVYYGQIRQVFSRLFPFGRGLCHAYWAPNFWVFYIVLDKMLAFLLAKLGFNIQTPKASFTGGLVGDSSSFAVLLQVTPVITFLLVLLAMFLCLVKAFLKPQPKSIIRWVTYACTCGFMFGWHVHEKASLHIIIPLGVIAMNSLDDARHFFLVSIVSCYSMFSQVGPYCNLYKLDHWSLIILRVYYFYHY